MTRASWLEQSPLSLFWNNNNFYCTNLPTPIFTHPTNPIFAQRLRSSGRCCCKSNDVASQVKWREKDDIQNVMASFCFFFWFAFLDFSHSSLLLLYIYTFIPNLIYFGTLMMMGELEDENHLDEKLAIVRIVRGPGTFCCRSWMGFSKHAWSDRDERERKCLFLPKVSVR